MARDQVAVMPQLGFERFAVAGHDRGARWRTGWRSTTPSASRALAVLDIIPTGEVFRRTDMRLALGTGTGSSWPSPTTCRSG